MNMNFHCKLPIPMDVKAEYPVTSEMAAIKAKRDAEIQAIFEGKDERFVLIIGPCSADRPDSVLEYIGKLRDISD